MILYHSLNPAACPMPLHCGPRTLNSIFLSLARPAAQYLLPGCLTSFRKAVISGPALPLEPDWRLL